MPRRKLEKVVEFYIGEIVGRGKNKTEAKKDAKVKADAALQGSYIPILISCGGKSALVYREPATGWGYVLLHPERANKEQDHSARLYHNGGIYADRDEAERAARRHLAQNVFEVGGATGLELLRDERDIKEHLGWCVFQYAYRAWRDAGYSDVDAHDKAGRYLYPEGATPWVLPEKYQKS